jgi:hypothetical protein
MPEAAPTPLMSGIVTSNYRYNRPPKRRKPVEIEQAIVTGTTSSRDQGDDPPAAADSLSKSARPEGTGGIQHEHTARAAA